MLRQWRLLVMRRPLLLLVAWLAAIGVAVFVITDLAPKAEAQSTLCRAAHRPPPSNAEPVQVMSADGKFVMKFGDSWAERTRSVQLQGEPGVSPADKLVPFLASGYLENDAGDQIQLTDQPQVPTGLEAHLIYISSLRHVQLCLTVIPDILRRTHGLGRYTGGIGVGREGDDLALATVPVELTFRASHWKAVYFALLGVLLGLVVKVLSEAARRQREPEVGAGQALKEAAANWTFSVTLVVGVIAGLIVCWKTYGGDQTWGASGGDIATLIVACFLIQLSSVEGVDLVKRVAGSTGGS
jgi:hypothetical protein